MIKHIFYSVLFLCGIAATAQETTNYLQPPKEIVDLIDVPLAPAIRLANESEDILFYYRDRYQSIDYLSQPEMRLGGLRINPATNLGSRTRFYNHLELGSLMNINSTQVTVLPSNQQQAHFFVTLEDNSIHFI